MKKYFEQSAISVTTKEDIEEMKLNLQRGIISFKVSRNDNITKLAASMEELFSLQRMLSKNPTNQGIMAMYIEANEKAGLAYSEIKKIGDKYREYQTKQRKRRNEN